MINLLENFGFEIVKENVEENRVSRRLEDGETVVILEQRYYPPDEIENSLYIIKGELDIDLELDLEHFDVIIEDLSGD